MMANTLMNLQRGNLGKGYYDDARTHLVTTQPTFTGAPDFRLPQHAAAPSAPAVGGVTSPVSVTPAGLTPAELISPYFISVHTAPHDFRCHTPQPVGSDCAHTQDKLTGLEGFQSVRHALLRTSNVIKDLDHLLENNDLLSCSALSTSIIVIKAYKHIYAHLSFNTVKVLVKSHITRYFYFCIKGYKPQYL